VLWKWILRAVVGQLIGRLDKRKGARYLLMDATCWELDKVKFHFLTLSILLEGVSIPFFLVNLAKKGCSNGRERKRLLQMADLLYGLTGMTRPKKSLHLLLINPDSNLHIFFNPKYCLLLLNPSLWSGA